VGTLTTWTYTAGDLTKITVDAGSGRLNLETEFVYSPAGSVIESKDPRDFTTAYEYDQMRRLKKIIEPTGDYTLNTYNGNGWLTKVERFDESHNLEQPTATEYFKDGQVKKTYNAQCFDAAGAATYSAAGCAIVEYSYDSAGRLEIVTDPDGRKTKRSYDAAGRLAALTSGFQSTLAQATATYTYSKNGRRLSAMDANGNLTQFAYNPHDRLAEVAYASDKVCSASTPCTTASPNLPASSHPDREEFTYDANGNPTSKRTRGGDFILRTFDAMNRETQRETRVGTSSGTLQRKVLTEFDAASKVEEVTETLSGYEVSYGYDTAGRVTSETSDDGSVARTMSYALDASGNTTGISWPENPDLFVGYAYNSLNLVSEICYDDVDGSCDSLPHYAQYTYDDLARRGSTTLGNSRTVSYTYEKDSMLHEIVQPDLIDTDSNGVGDADAVWDFTFNPSNQVASKSLPMAFNWQPGSGGIGAFDYVSNGLNQIESVEAVAYNYDTKGNLTSDGTWTFTYDAENRLTGASKTSGGTVTATYSYDPLDRRISKTVNGLVTKYLWAGQNVVAEYDDEDTLLRRYVHGAGVDEPVAQIEYSPATGTTYFHQDHLGTVVAITDDEGDLVDSFSYSTHGEVGIEGSEGAIWRFAGRQYDKETGLYYNRARYYSPRDGRFLQVDPAGDVDSLNLYQYAMWDPITNKDPTGLAVCGKGEFSESECNTLMEEQKVAREKVLQDTKQLQEQKRGLQAGEQTKDTQRQLVRIDDKIRTNEKAASVLDEKNSSYVYVKGPGQRAFASNDPSGTQFNDKSYAYGQIGIPGRFFSNSTGRGGRQHTLIHEGGHFGGLDDLAYVGELGYSGLSERQRLLNADSYACSITNLPGC